MEYVRFGSSGLRISRIALGMGLRGQRDEREAERLIRRAFDGGVNLFDCANIYGPADDRAYAGHSEQILGRALKSVRDEVVITSKVVGQIGPGPNDRGASRYHIYREVERSLHRLGTDRIDVYLLHSFDDQTPLEEQFRALDDLVQHGKVQYVGVCNYQAWQVCHALWTQERINAASLITVQNPYSLLNRRLEDEMFPMVRTLGLGVMAYAPLATGLLSGAYKVGQPAPAGTLWGDRRRGHLERVLAGQPGLVLTSVEEIAARVSATVAQVALKWALSRTEISCVTSGADSDRQMDENLGALDVKLSPEDIATLDRASAGLTMTLDGPEFAAPT
ncbi:MAG: aldo/keto reductase [Chloroflexota bacterium]|nr:MAG: aldo/keto reductase [Chloroflexota bacterium]